MATATAAVPTTAAVATATATAIAVVSAVALFFVVVSADVPAWVLMLVGAVIGRRRRVPRVTGSAGGRPPFVPAA
jgi:hypothetical protein